MGSTKKLKAHTADKTPTHKHELIQPTQHSAKLAHTHTHTAFTMSEDGDSSIPPPCVYERYCE